MLLLVRHRERSVLTGCRFQPPGCHRFWPHGNQTTTTHAAGNVLPACCCRNGAAVCSPVLLLCAALCCVQPSTAGAGDTCSLNAHMHHPCGLTGLTQKHAKQHCMPSSYAVLASRCQLLVQQVLLLDKTAVLLRGCWCWCWAAARCLHAAGDVATAAKVQKTAARNAAEGCLQQLRC